MNRIKPNGTIKQDIAKSRFATVINITQYQPLKKKSITPTTTTTTNHHPKKCVVLISLKKISIRLSRRWDVTCTKWRESRARKKWQKVSKYRSAIRSARLIVSNVDCCCLRCCCCDVCQCSFCLSATHQGR